MRYQIKDKHNFLQGLLMIDDMFLTSHNRVMSYFLSDVMDFFKIKEIYASPNISIMGYSEIEHKFDFLISKNKKHEERLIKVINNLQNRDKFMATIYAFKDVEERGAEDFIIYNDLNKPLSDEYLKALELQKISPLAWSEKEQWHKNLSDS